MCKLEHTAHRTKWEIVGRIRRYTLIWDMVIPISESLSMSERSNIKSSLPDELSMDRAFGCKNECDEEN